MFAFVQSPLLRPMSDFAGIAIQAVTACEAFVLVNIAPGPSMHATSLTSRCFNYR